jgi:methylglutaconyl-CoA hydratase
MLLAAPFGTDEALRCGLVHRVVPPNELDAAIDETVANLLRGAPGALAATKRLLATMPIGDPAAARAATTALLAERLASDEGREGLRAFLDKRPAAWVPDGLETR